MPSMPSKLLPLISAIVMAAAFASLQCNQGTQGLDTGATCPPASTLTYANFGQPFMDKYCTSCHAGNERPSLTTAAQVKSAASQIMATTASGPNGTNTSMPPGDEPTTDERTQLGQWLACGAP